MANIPLLRKTLEWAETEAALTDGAWDQDNWATVPIEAIKIALERGQARRVKDPDYGREIIELPENVCGMAGCFAGNAVVSAGLGDRLLITGPGLEAELQNDWDDTVGIDECVTATGEVMPIWSRAQQILELTKIQRERLFDSDNSIEDLRRIAEEIAGERL